MTLLQAKGVAAGVARRPFDLLTDPHLLARGFWREVERPFIGAHYQTRPRSGKALIRILCAVPRRRLGQDNEAILGGRLGLIEPNSIGWRLWR